MKKYFCLFITASLTLLYTTYIKAESVGDMEIDASGPFNVSGPNGFSANGFGFGFIELTGGPGQYTISAM
ncbi:hypothetical protein JW960_16090 [candidate division KSB1 bacterium]|nr:hypothetical protein [candidate division KSB1 bacterium]